MPSWEPKHSNDFASLDSIAARSAPAEISSDLQLARILRDVLCMKLPYLSFVLFLLIHSTALATAPNIVFVLIDDMHWNGTSVQIDPDVPASKSSVYQTPELEKMAAEGMRFTNAYSPGPMCTPTRAGILSGKTPAEIHITKPGGGRTEAAHKLASGENLRDFPTEIITIAETLKSAGYATAHLGKWHLGRSDPGEHGFDLHDGATTNDVPNSSPENPKEVMSLTERAGEFMEKQSRSGTPFYLHLSHYAVHAPIETRESSEARFANLPSSGRRDLRSFAGMTYDLDYSIGLLRAKIEALGIADNTYVVVMSDNGGHDAESNGRRGGGVLNSGKGSLYEGGIRVPFFVVGPGIPEGSLSRESITGCDLYPTFCTWANARTPEGLEGVDLSSLLAGDTRELESRGLLFHYPHYGQGAHRKPLSALIYGDYKVVLDWESRVSELFDLSKDLTESKDIGDTFPEKKLELQHMLANRLKEVGASLPTENANYDPNASVSTKKRSRK
ncbi:MAG: sulfatase [Opitutaceae bacterium]